MRQKKKLEKYINRDSVTQGIKCNTHAIKFLKRWAIKKENFKEILVSKFPKFGEKYAFTEAGSLATPKEDKYKEPHICIS